MCERIVRPFLTRHHPAAAMLYYGQGLWLKETFYVFLSGTPKSGPPPQPCKTVCQSSKGEWDLMNVVATIPAEAAYRPLSESECPLIKK